jgi:hypothetical protein
MSTKKYTFNFSDEEEDEVEQIKLNQCISCGEYVDKLYPNSYRFKKQHCEKCRSIITQCTGKVYDKGEYRQCKIKTLRNGCIYHEDRNTLTYTKCINSLLRYVFKINESKFKKYNVIYVINTILKIQMKCLNIIN